MKPFNWFHNDMKTQRIRVGDIYEDCSYQPCVATEIDRKDDCLSGISIIDGCRRSCSFKHCRPLKMTIKQAVKRRKTWGEFISPIRKKMMKGGWWTKDDNHLKFWRYVRTKIEPFSLSKVVIFDRYF